MTVVREFFALLGLEVEKRDFQAADQALNNIKDLLKTVVIGATAVAGAVAYATREFVKQANQLDDWSNLTGESVERLDALRIAVNRIGGDANQTVNGMVNLGNRIRDVLNAKNPENNPTSKALRDLGLKIGDLRDTPVPEVFEHILDRMQEIPDASRRSAIAMDLFGTHGGKAIATLDVDQLREFRDEAIALGIVMTEGDVKAAKMFQASFRGLIAVMQSMIGTGIAPLLTHLTRFGRFLTQWILLNREIIKQRFERTAELLAKAVGFLLPKLRDYLSFAGDLVKALGGLETITKAVAIVTGLYLAAQIGTVLTSAFGAAIAAVKSFNLWLVLMKVALYAEIVAVGLLAAVIVLAVDEMITSLKGGETVIDDFFNSKKIKPNENILVTALRAVLLQIGLVIKAWESLSTVVSEGFTSTIGRKAIKTGLEAVRLAAGFSGVFDQNQAARFLEGKNYAQPIDVEQLDETRQLPLLKIPPPPSVSPRVGGDTTTTTLTVSAPITVNAPGGDPHAIAIEVGREFEKVVTESARKLQGDG